MLEMLDVEHRWFHINLRTRMNMESKNEIEPIHLSSSIDVRLQIMQ